MKTIFEFFTSKDTSTKAKRGLLIAAIVIALVVAIIMAVVIAFFSKQFSVINAQRDMMLNMFTSNHNQSHISDSDSKVFEDEELEFAAEEQLSTSYRIEFLDVGAADCTLITNGKDSMLIDTGDNLDGNMIVDYLQSCDILSLSTVLCTNESSEHIGGLYSILSNLEVETLIVPNPETENEVLKNCIGYAIENGIQVLAAKAYEAWNIGEAQCQILSAEQNVITRVVVGKHAFLMMSDATAAEEKALLDLEIDITAKFLKAANHGAEGTSYDDFLRAIEADTAVVSCDADIAKPNIKTMNRLYNRSTTFRTDINDSVIVITDGLYYRVTSEWTNCDGNYDYN